MPDVFISFTTADRELAHYVRGHLHAHGLDVFLAPLSIPSGYQGDQAILTALKAAPWVLVLASKAACSSPYVLQEFGIAVGVALGVQKAIIPVVWDMDPGKLPGWLSRYQAIDLREDLPTRLGPALDHLVGRVKAKKQEGATIFAAFIAGLALLAVAGSDKPKPRRRRTKKRATKRPRRR
jgi:hypothetical protein